MRATAFRTTAFTHCLAVLASCGSPPEVPTVDESTRRPANSPQAVELQVCRHDLQASRLEASESGRIAGSASATLARLAAQRPTEAFNKVFVVRFDFGSAKVAVPPGIVSALLDEAKGAPLVLLRGRTDAAADSPADSRIARARAAAVRDYLVAAGVDAKRIRITHQPSGDTAADNATAPGRALNRRVEIEVYRALPVVVG